MPKKDVAAVTADGVKIRNKPIVTIPVSDYDENKRIAQIEKVTVTDAKGSREYVYERGKRIEIEPEAFIVLKRRYPNL